MRTLESMVRRSFAAGVVAVLFAFVGCKSPEEQLAAADGEVRQIIKAKRKAALGKDTPFSAASKYAGRSPEDISPAEIIKDRLKKRAKTVTINSLKDVLRFATKHNREFQTKRESLLLSALSLSDARHAYSTIWSHELSAERGRDTDGRGTGEMSNKFSVGKLFRSGGNLGLSLANDLFRYYSGDPSRTASSTLSINISQPLLRGAGKDIAAENLKQAERNVIYEVRSFSRFQKTFAVDVATSYFRLIQRRDTVFNEYNNYLNLVRARERAQELAKDRMPEFQVDQTRQSELVARNRYITAVEQYESDLDEFKVLLGASLDEDIRIGAEGLKDLMKRKIRKITLTPDNAFAIATEKRLDFLTVIDRFEDSKRKVKVAGNQLLSDLEFYGNASLASSGDTNFERFNFKNWTGSAGLRFKLPLDRVLERNDYRRELIDFEQSLRSLALSVDRLKTDIRAALRSLDQKAKSYQIQKTSVDLAERRVESANILLQAGRVSTRDLLDAQDDLISAKNNLTRNLVDYHLARWRLLRDIGMIELRDGDIAELQAIESPVAMKKSMGPKGLITPDELFGTEGKP